MNYKNWIFQVVKVNLVYNTDTNPSTSYTLNDNTAVLLVKLVPHDNATINNKNKVRLSLYCIVPYSTVPYCIILYCTV